MRWEELTSDEFATAVRNTGVCLISMSVIEKHSTHLPLGTDLFNGHAVACLAAEKEPAVVFPPFYFGQIYEAKCFPGTITIPPRLLLELIFEVLDEIGRNGFRKIILYCAHGGNAYLLPLITQATLAAEKPYCVYSFNGLLRDCLNTAARQDEWDALLETPVHGHACECETSLILAHRPDLVKMDRLPEKPADPLRRMEHLANAFTALSWYADYPQHYAGDARPASAVKGRHFLELMADSLAEFIAAVKKDEVLPALSKEFFNRS